MTRWPGRRRSLGSSCSTSACQTLRSALSARRGVSVTVMVKVGRSPVLVTALIAHANDAGSTICRYAASQSGRGCSVSLSGRGRIGQQMLAMMGTRVRRLVVLAQRVGTISPCGYDTCLDCRQQRR